MLKREADLAQAKEQADTTLTTWHIDTPLTQYLHFNAVPEWLDTTLPRNEAFVQVRVLARHPRHSSMLPRARV